MKHKIAVYLLPWVFCGGVVFSQDIQKIQVQPNSIQNNNFFELKEGQYEFQFKQSASIRLDDSTVQPNFRKFLIDETKHISGFSSFEKFKFSIMQIYTAEEGRIISQLKGCKDFDYNARLYVINISDYNSNKNITKSINLKNDNCITEKNDSFLLVCLFLDEKCYDNAGFQFIISVNYEEKDFKYQYTDYWHPLELKNIGTRKNVLLENSTELYPKEKLIIGDFVWYNLIGVFYFHITKKDVLEMEMNNAGINLPCNWIIYKGKINKNDYNNYTKHTVFSMDKRQSSNSNFDNYFAYCSDTGWYTCVAETNYNNYQYNHTQFDSTYYRFYRTTITAKYTKMPKFISINEISKPGKLKNKLLKFGYSFSIKNITVMADLNYLSNTDYIPCIDSLPQVYKNSNQPVYFYTFFSNRKLGRIDIVDTNVALLEMAEKSLIKFVKRGQVYSHINLTEYSLDKKKHYFIVSNKPVLEFRIVKRERHNHINFVDSIFDFLSWLAGIILAVIIFFSRKF